MEGHRSPSIIQKPWGTEEIWASTHHSIGKILTINKGHRLSRKYHKMKNHTIRILEGTLTLEIGPRFEGEQIQITKLRPGMVYYLSCNTIHRFCAEDNTVKIIEVSSSGPDDSVRLADDYRRITDIPQRTPQSDK
jgi:mannose-6-phosphate isomerase-like protein (cupin superfamily)